MQSSGVRTITLKRKNTLLPLLEAHRLAEIINQEAPDIMHMHWGKDIRLTVLSKCLSQHSVKLVYSRQMMITRNKKDVYHRLLYKHIDLYLTITKQLRDKAREFLPIPDDKIKMLYYGVKQPRLLSPSQRQIARQELGIQSVSDLAIGLVGRIEEKKGQHLLIEAVHLLREQGLAVHATLVGPVMDKLYFSRIQSQVKQLDLNENVTLYGSHPNPIDIMQAFDIIVLTTEVETFGLVLIEAMRNGVAVVGSNAGGVPEIIKDGVSGLLFESCDAVDLADKLVKYCMDSDLRNKNAAAGKARADRLFSVERHYQGLKQIFIDLINER
jgi:glycosyltransferase involved in cell wall biosynthesis